VSRNEAGYTFIELAVSVIIIGLVLLIMMPSLQGYQTNAQIRETGATIVAQIRAAEVESQSMGEAMEWWACYDCSPPTFKITVPNTGQVINSETLQQQAAGGGATGQNWHSTGTCYRGPITPQGTITVATPPCAVPPGATFELLCFDSGTPANPFGIKITVVILTGQVISTTVGQCS
jgi:type II secretory pathway pseudopilin PulG